MLLLLLLAALVVLLVTVVVLLISWSVEIAVIAAVIVLLVHDDGVNSQHGVQTHVLRLQTQSSCISNHMLLRLHEEGMLHTSVTGSDTPAQPQSAPSIGDYTMVGHSYTRW